MANADLSGLEYLLREIKTLPASNPLALAGLELIYLERSLREALGARSKGKTLRALLLQATDKKSGFLQFDGSNAELFAISDLRNTILHGCFEDGAKSCGAATIAAYFREHMPKQLKLLHDLVEKLQSVRGR